MLSKNIKLDLSLHFIRECAIIALSKFSLRNYISRPILLIIYVFAILSLLEVFQSESDNAFKLSIIVSLAIWLLLYFSNFAETFSELKGKALRSEFTDYLQHKDLLVVRDNKELQIAESELLESDLIKVTAGHIIPLDGDVVQGLAMVDESPITGESAPIYKENTEGRNNLLAGSKVISDALLYRPYNIKKEVTHNVKKIKTSENEKAITIFLFSIALANIVMVLSFFGVLSAFKINLDDSFLLAFIICIIPSTAAALVDTVSISGSVKMLKANFISFNPNIIDIASDINLVVLDKTGTITTGMREVEEIIAYHGVAQEELVNALHLSSCEDETQEGKAIMQYLNSNHKKTLKKTTFNNYKFIPFNSFNKFSGCANGSDDIKKGSLNSIESLLQKDGVEIDMQFHKAIEPFMKKGKTPIVIIKNDKILGACILKDTLKEGIREKITKLSSMGIKTILVTGDNINIAKNYAEETGITEYYGDASPEDKKNIISELKSSGNIVAMCGEGINDNLALANSDLGFTCIESDITTRNSSDIIDLDNDPLKIIQLIEISRNLLSTKGCITTFSMTSDIAKYFAILPTILAPIYPVLASIDILSLSSAESAVASSIIFNTLIVLMFLPLAFTGVKRMNYKTLKVVKLFFLIFGLGGLIIPFFGIKLIDMIINGLFL